MSKKPPRHEEHEEHDEHIDERWLVSYSDMMTLLFGLFVMLFSIASEKQGNFKEELQNISKSSFAQAGTPAKVEEPIQAEEIEKKKQEQEDQKILTENLNKENENLRAELETVKKARHELDQKQTETTQAEAIKDEQIQKLKKQLAAVSHARPVKDEDVDHLKKRLAQIEDAALEKQETLQAELVTLKKKMAQQKEEAKRSIASEPPPPPPKEAPEKAELAKEKLELERLKTESAQDKTNLEARTKDLEAKAKDLQSKNDELKKKLDEIESQKKSGQFMMVVLKWTSEKHDLDLTVTDPQGNVFNFKNRKYAGHPGEFTLDSRSGPGAEIWQTDKIIPGEYIVSWKLYNTYGNDKPVTYSGIISSNSDKIEIPPSTLPAKVGAEKSIRIQVDASGKLSRP